MAQRDDHCCDGCARCCDQFYSDVPLAPCRRSSSQERCAHSHCSPRRPLDGNSSSTGCTRRFDSARSRRLDSGGWAARRMRTPTRTGIRINRRIRSSGKARHECGVSGNLGCERQRNGRGHRNRASNVLRRNCPTARRAAARNGIRSRRASIRRLHHEDGRVPRAVRILGQRSAKA